MYINQETGLLEIPDAAKEILLYLAFGTHFFVVTIPPIFYSDDSSFIQILGRLEFFILARL